MERNGIEYDPETNLPKLREGLFWRISGYDSGYLSIAIVESVAYYKHSFLGIYWGESTEYREFEGLFDALNEADMMSDDRIKTISENLYRRLLGLEKTTARKNLLMGIYPPKKL